MSKYNTRLENILMSSIKWFNIYNRVSDACFVLYKYEAANTSQTGFAATAQASNKIGKITHTLVKTAVYIV